MSSYATTDRSRSWAPLSNVQKARLSILAKEAFERVGRGDPNEWRRDQSIKCCGRRITEATQRDYLRLKAHFEDLAGESGRAMNTHIRAESEPTRVAMSKLKRECGIAKVALSYPEAICQRQYHCSLAEASEKQIWNLVFTVRSRARDKRSAPVWPPSTKNIDIPF